ncbi:hypothetical protein CU098_009053, partial [Rhizopus stolonifer]
LQEAIQVKKARKTEVGEVEAVVNPKRMKKMHAIVHLVDMRWIRSAWGKVSFDTIRNSWRHTYILSLSDDEDATINATTENLLANCDINESIDDMIIDINGHQFSDAK